MINLTSEDINYIVWTNTRNTSNYTACLQLNIRFKKKKDA